MKKNLLALLLFAGPLIAQPDPPRLIVRADDFGSSHAANQAILESCLEGVATSIEVMVPAPWFPEAVQLLKDHPTLDVGVHLTLSSEWDTLKWRPVSDCPSLCDSNGYFFPMIFRNPNYTGNALMEQPWKLQDVEREFRAQIEVARRQLPGLSHISHHMGCNALNSEVRALAKRLAQEYQLDIDPQELGVTSVGYFEPDRSPSQQIDGFLQMLEKLEPGRTYLFVEHPGLDTPEMRAIRHIGYENVAAHRQGVTDTFTSPRIRERIEARGIQLIRYRDLKP